MSDSDSQLDRYSRQMRFPPIGEPGQRALREATALVCGCGALGSVLANTLARAGVGKLRIVDRDFLELNNLQRQVLYDENDVAEGLPKAVAAAAKLQRINSEIEIEPIVADVDCENILSLIDGADVVVDGTDNFETRFLVNDASLRTGVPWVYGGCIGAEGQSMTILPGDTACLRCLHPDAPPPGSTPTCDAAGILGPIINVIASIQACEAIKILSGNRAAVSRALAIVELWDNRLRHVKLDKLRAAAQCPACRGEEFPWLDGQKGSQTAVLCGRNAVQLSFAERKQINLDHLAEQLNGVGQVARNAYLLRLEVDEYRLTVFPDGRAIIQGTEEIAEAKTVYAKYIGS
ncbi:MAG: ThiF family adenylyltransferase [Pirellulaceae bacterium]|jgi:adenylyltransferase/sulfurtransferase|nr:ThiF family adenylyltransferase [Pirellulaceae bacterium]MDP7015782.1 ThiF family adenylyltransferase [Pirellulaceae bacterium]